MPTDPVSLDRPLRIHVVGIGGAGMSGLARLLCGFGHTVSGSDLVDSPTLAALQTSGIAVHVGHDAANVGDVDLVTASPAVAADNAELVAADARGIRVASRAEVLGSLSELREMVAIAGTHGKTTTSSMLTVILATAGRSPSWLVGADVAGLGANARVDGGDELVVEADESYGSFAKLSPALCAVTNIEADHLDHYGTLATLRDAFLGLLERSAACVVNGDDRVARELSRIVAATLVGTDPAFDVVVSDVRLDRASSQFVLRHGGAEIDVRVGAPGPHNVQNAALAAAVALLRGVSGDAVVEALSRFAGVPRRFEFRGEVRGATMVDDYAHLPSEVAAVLATARAGGFRRVVAVFQPHRYTRTSQLAAAFARAFDDADVVVVTDVYAAGEPPLPGVTGRLVADAIAGSPSAPEVRYVKDRAALAAEVAPLLRAGDLLLTMGAGDLTTLPDELRDEAA